MRIRRSRASSDEVRGVRPFVSSSPSLVGGSLYSVFHLTNDDSTTAFISSSWSPAQKTSTVT